MVPVGAPLFRQQTILYFLMIVIIMIIPAKNNS